MALGRLGKYERVDVLGHGVSGIVYLAWDTLLKRQVALKEIDLQAADVSRFLEEARVMDRMHHPNIVHINGVDMIEGHVVIDMEYVKGLNLQQMLRAEGRLPVDRALDIAIQTLAALDYAHSMHTVHRDIKPANILISRAGEVKLVDFGLAEILATNSYAGGAGTYAYMAPEDFAEEHRSDHQSDIWAVGVTLYEMLTGRRPFSVEKTKDPFAWRRTLLGEDPAPLTPVRPPDATGRDDGVSTTPPAGLQEVVDRALARDKQRRYQTAGEFLDALQRIRGALPGAPADTAVVRVPVTAERPGVASGRPPMGPAPAGVAAPPVLVVPQPAEGRGNGAGASTEGRRSGVRALVRKRPSVPLRATAEPDAVDFGEVRMGDERSATVRVRFEGNAGPAAGSVASAPGWLEVSPAMLSRRKQAVRLTAITERVWQPGDYEDVVRFDTSGGEVRLPVGIRVLKPRRTFAEVAVWFVPLLMSVLLPAFTVAWGARLAPADARHLVPAAALGSGLLAGMLLLVAAEADLGMGERAACALWMAVMALVLGVTVGVAARTNATDALRTMAATGVPFGILLAVQVGTRHRWKLWAWGVSLLALTASGVFASVLS